MKKIKFINPSVYTEKDHLLKFKKLYIPGVQLLLLAALTPDNFEVSYTDELVDEVDLDEKTDLVCLSLNTFQARRAYALGDEFRKRGRKVVLGGIHASILPEEAKEHADSVVIGEAEGFWEEILEDFNKGGLKPYYRVKTPPLMDIPLVPRLDLLNKKRLGHLPFTNSPIIPIDTSRGCPNRCDFCSISPFHEKLRLKPIEVLLQEIKSIGAKYYFFTDSNICANRSRAKELFKKLIPLKIKWLSNFTINAAEDPEFIKLAVKSGCIAAYIGFESLNEDNLKQMNKRTNKVHLYKKYIDIYHRCGLPIHGSIIIGMDFDTQDSIEETVRFIINNHIDKISLYTFIPLPGTKLYEKLKKENRLLTPKFWLEEERQIYNIHYQPKNFSTDELEELFWKSYQEIYSFRGIIKRLLMPPQQQWKSSLVSNLLQRRIINKKQLTFS